MDFQKLVSDLEPPRSPLIYASKFPTWFIGEWNSPSDVFESWEWSREGVGDGYMIVVAQYEEPYSGSAYMLYERDGQLYEVSDDHCSCNGFDRFQPTQVTPEYLRRQYVAPDDHSLNGRYRRAVREFLHTISKGATPEGSS